MSEDNQSIEQRIANSIGLIMQNDEYWNNAMISLARKHDNLDDLGESIKEWIEENSLKTQDDCNLDDIAFDLMNCGFEFCDYSELAEYWENSLKPKGIEYTIYEGFLSLIYNSDESGLEEDEIQAFNAWFESEGIDMSKGSFWHDSDADSEYADCEILDTFSDCVTVVWVLREESTEETLEK